MPGAVSVRPALADGDDAAWDAYVHAHPQGTFFHLSGWRRVIERSFRHRPHYLLAERGGSVAGVLPLFHTRTLFGNGLVSTPFCVYGGPLASDDEARAALLDRAGQTADALGARYLELRCRQPVSAGWPAKRDLYATFRRAITADAEANLKAIPRKQRAVVRHALKGELVAEIVGTVDELHHVYACSVRNLGSPVVPKRYFAALKAEFGDACELLLIRARDGTAVSGVMSFYFRDEVLPYYGGGLPEARRSGANDLMYWDLMRRAGAAGCRIFDFGRSKAGTGAFDFKKNWGFAPEFLSYEYRLAPGQALPDNNPNNPKFRIFIETWKRLPLPVTNLLGPYLVRGLG